MSDTELSADSKRAKLSRKKRLDRGYTRFDCLVNPQSSKYALRVMRKRGFGNKTEMVEMLINEEHIRLRQAEDAAKAEKDNQSLG